MRPEAEIFFSRLRSNLGLAEGEPRFVRGTLPARTPVRVILEGESRAADAVISKGKRDGRGRYQVKVQNLSGQYKLLWLGRWNVMHRP